MPNTNLTVDMENLLVERQGTQLIVRGYKEKDLQCTVSFGRFGSRNWFVSNEKVRREMAEVSEEESTPVPNVTWRLERSGNETYPYIIHISWTEWDSKNPSVSRTTKGDIFLTPNEAQTLRTLLLF